MHKRRIIKLPGIGPYTAGAIASIAYGQRVSAVDGNVIRVFSRLYDICEDVTKTSVKKQIEMLVDESLPSKEEISYYNQALMELGALICIPKSPRCDICPIKNIAKLQILLLCLISQRKVHVKSSINMCMFGYIKIRFML